MREFEEQLARQEEDLNLKAADLQKQREDLERQQEQLNAQKVELQQVTELICLIPAHWIKKNKKQEESFKTSKWKKTSSVHLPYKAVEHMERLKTQQVPPPPEMQCK